MKLKRYTNVYTGNFKNALGITYISADT